MTPGERSTGPLVLVIMGVSGTGKSTVGGILADRLGWPFEEGDDLHPPANLAKMAAGHPLDDDDRRPWLDRVAAWIDERLADGGSGVITCSALKRRYRDRLCRPQVQFVFLTGDPSLIKARLAARHGHFMPSSLLDSQLADLEAPGQDENAIAVDVAAPPAQQAATVIERLHAA